MKFGDNTENQGLRLIRGTEDVAMLILGHDHAAGYSNTSDLNSAGEPVLVVNGGGQELTKSVFRFTEDDAIRSQLTDADGELIRDVIIEYIRQRTSEQGCVSPEDFGWHREIVYGADIDALPMYEGEAGAVLAAVPEDGHAYVIYHEAQELALTARETNGGLDAVACPAEGAVLPAPLPQDAVVFTVHTVEEGIYIQIEPVRSLHLQLLSCSRTRGDGAF